MLMANGTSDWWRFDDLSPGPDDGDRFSMDIVSLFDILDESPDVLQNGLEDSSSNIVQQGKSASHVGVNELLLQSGLLELEAAPSLSPDLPRSLTVSPSYHSEASDCRTVGSDGSFESAGNSVIIGCAKLEPSSQTGSPMQYCSGSLSDWVMPVQGNGTSSVERYGVYRDVSSYGQPDYKRTQFEMANCSATFNFTDGDGNLQLEKSGITHGTHCEAGEDSFKTSGAHDIEETSVMDFGEIHDILYESGNENSMHFMSMNKPFYFSPSRQYVFESFGLQSVSNDDEMIVSNKA